MMSHTEFQLVGGHPALDFVNSLDWRFRDSGPEELLGTHADLVPTDSGAPMTIPQALARCGPVGSCASYLRISSIPSSMDIRPLLRAFARWRIRLRELAGNSS
jgi:hypothetical protein